MAGRDVDEDLEAAIVRLSEAARQTAAPLTQLATSTRNEVTDWKQAAGRTDGKEGYQFGDVSRSLLKSTTELVARTKERFQPEDTDSSSAATSADPSIGIASTVARGMGQLIGASKGVITATALGMVKGGVALTDRLYENSANQLVNEDVRERFQSRIGFQAGAIAAEVAPLLGNIAAAFFQGSLEGHAAAHGALASAYQTVVPVEVQLDMQCRIEQRLGAVMEHLVEPAVLEALSSFYRSKVKPQLIDDWWMPDYVRRAAHDVSDQIAHDLMLELPNGLNMLVGTNVVGTNAEVSGGRLPKRLMTTDCVIASDDER